MPELRCHTKSSEMAPPKVIPAGKPRQSVRLSQGSYLIAHPTASQATGPPGANWDWTPYGLHTLASCYAGIAAVDLLDPTQVQALLSREAPAHAAMRRQGAQPTLDPGLQALTPAGCCVFVVDAAMTGTVVICRSQYPSRGRWIAAWTCC